MNRRYLDEVLESTPRIRFDNRKVYGVGINDSQFQVTMWCNNQKVQHSAYATWKGILQRCYSNKFQKNYPTYAGCSICEEWKLFSNFLKWWKTNFKEGYQIDKDITSPGNEVYSPELCVFVPPDLNGFVTDCEARGNIYAIGVTYYKPRGKFRARIWDDGKLITLGLYDTEKEAHESWYERKISIAHKFKPICDDINESFFNCLLMKIESMRVEL
ncbi:hypothetical protein RCIP0091_00067 [Klebsiella phage RCIP0091]